MIVRHIPMASVKKASFVHLVAYLTGSQGKTERVGDIRTTNCLSDEPELAALEVLNTQRCNTRAKAEKTFHLVVSFAPGEVPTAKVIADIEDRLCAAIGFQEHQRVSVVHHDTASTHLHIAINKIHPTRHTIHEPYRAYLALGRLCEQLEQEHGLQRIDHRARKQASESEAVRMEHHAGRESLLTWIRRACAPQMAAAPSWQAMHQLLHEHGLSLRERGNGLVLCSDDGAMVKASTVARGFSRAALEARLGPYEPPSVSPAPVPPSMRYTGKPVAAHTSTDTPHETPSGSPKLVASQRAQAWSRARSNKDRRILQAKRKWFIVRSALRLSNASYIAKRLGYSAANRALRREVRAILRDYARDRQAIYQQHRHAIGEGRQGVPDTAYGLAALRALLAPPPGRYPGHRQAKDRPRGQAPSPAVLDEGSRLRIGERANLADLQQALRLATARYGGCIAVNGSAHFREHIAVAAAQGGIAVSFDDAVLEQRRQQLIRSIHAEEMHHETPARTVPGGRGTDRSGPAEPGARAATSSGQRSTPTGLRRGDPLRAQPDAGQPPARAPSATADGLPVLSQFSVVLDPARGEVLLPGDVPDHVEHDRPQPDHGVRRRVHRPAGVRPGKPRAQQDKAKVAKTGTAPPPKSKDQWQQLSLLDALGDTPSIRDIERSPDIKSSRKPTSTAQENSAQKEKSAGSLAAIKYASEREQKRCKGFDIPKHRPYTGSKPLSAAYAGLRHVDGQALALLKVGDEVLVLPVTDYKAYRLRRIPIGQQLEISGTGAIQWKGIRR